MEAIVGKFAHITAHNLILASRDDL